jgi:hypothetical protein
VLLTWVVCLAVASTTKVGISQCTDAAIQQAQKQTAVAAPEYSKQILLARQEAFEIYDHGFLGNSGSAINNKVGRPPECLLRWQSMATSCGLRDLGLPIWNSVFQHPRDKVSDWKHFKALNFFGGCTTLRTETPRSGCSHTALCSQLPRQGSDVTTE